MALEGIDVSHYQGNIDWHAVAALGVKFAIIKASEGGSIDPARAAYYRDNRDRAKSVGIIPMPYHFFRGNVPGTAQVSAMQHAVGTLTDGDGIPWIDVETDEGEPSGVLIPRLEHILDGVAAWSGCSPGIYTFKSFWDSKFDGSFGGYPLWLARYGKDLPTKPAAPAVIHPPLPVGWAKYLILQYGDHGKVAGINGGGDSTDLDYYPGSLADLQAFIKECKGK